MPPDDPRLSLTWQWLERARQDFATANRMSQPPPEFDVVVVHCQQATEKALKAFLSWKNQQTRRTHDLTSLLVDCVAIEPAFDTLRPHTIRLAPYFADYRYPSSVPAPSAAEALAAVDAADAVYRFVLNRVPSAAHPASSTPPKDDATAEQRPSDD